MPALRLGRAPRTDDELDLLIQAMWGVKLPRVQVCPDHVSPFHAVAHAYFGREPNFAVWYASRGSGKSFALAVLGLTKCFVADADVTILGGSIWQSQNVRNHMRALLERPNAPRYAVLKDTEQQLQTTTKKSIKPLPASQTSVRGPHPPLQLLDEIDEMEYDIYQAALGQAMEQLNSRGEIVGEYIVASSTWQNPIGTMTTVIDDARQKGLPVFTWCWRELLDDHGGWMSRRFIESKRRTVSAEMWRTEYDLNEPSGSSRAFDLDAIERYFIEYPTPLREHHEPGQNDDWWIWEDPVDTATYAAGADWAKDKDKTVITVLRTDCFPRRVVALRRMNRMKYPVMTGAFNAWVKAYRAASQHDKTGVGNGLNDFLDEEAASGFIMTGRKRGRLFTDYISDFEHGGYVLPRQVLDFYKAHRGATVADVFAPTAWDEHTPDDVVSMALAHHAAGRSPIPEGILPVLDNVYAPRAVERQFHVQPQSTRTEGLVTIADWEPGGGDDMLASMSVGMEAAPFSDVSGWL